MDYTYSNVRKIISKAQEEGSYISFIFKDNKDNIQLTITNNTEVIYEQFHMWVQTIWIDYSDIVNIEVI